MASSITIRNDKHENLKNPAVAHCLNAWNHAFNRETAGLAEDDSEHDAIQAANDAYLRTMPPLSGLDNICDFIACVNFAYRIELIHRNESNHYLAQVKIALAAHGLRSKNGRNSFKRP